MTPEQLQSVLLQHGLLFMLSGTFAHGIINSQWFQRTYRPHPLSFFALGVCSLVFSLAGFAIFAAMMVGGWAWVMLFIFGIAHVVKNWPAD